MPHSSQRILSHLCYLHHSKPQSIFLWPICHRLSSLSKLWRASPSSPLLHGLCFQSCIQGPALSSCLSSLSDGMGSGAIRWNKCSPPQVTSGWCLWQQEKETRMSPKCPGSIPPWLPASLLWVPSFLYKDFKEKTSHEWALLGILTLQLFHTMNMIPDCYPLLFSTK